VALLSCLATPQAGAGKGPDPVRKAIKRGLKRLQRGSANYLENRQCFSCHHQALSILPLAAARRRGFPVDPDHMKGQVAVTIEWFYPKKEGFRRQKSIPGSATRVYALLALEAAGHPADETTAALVESLLQRQAKDGSWEPKHDRPPSEGSLFTNTGLALRVLRAYGPAKGAKDREELRKRIARAREAGLGWLRKNAPKSTEDKVFRLRGLVDGGATRKEVEAARTALLKEQRPDGSWAQLPEMSGDAYATGTALTALRSAGLPAESGAYRKGVNYLLRTQRSDGAWLVQTRSPPRQVFFDNGDPGGKSQFISFAATGWATLALLETLPVR
jgi:squalene cyclase